MGNMFANNVTHMHKCSPFKGFWTMLESVVSCLYIVVLSLSYRRVVRSAFINQLISRCSVSVCELIMRTVVLRVVFCFKDTISMNL